MMTSDSSSSTPTALTPQSTGSLDVSSVKKRRRQTTFYPNLNSTNKPQKPFSRSAAKRESVMALGSIEYLQHYFTKTGIAAKKQSLDKPHRGLVPAIGGLSNVETEDSPSFEIPELLVPPPPAPPPPAPPNFPKTYETNPDSLLPGMVEDLNAVARAWGIQDTGLHAHDPKYLGTGDPKTTTTSHFNVLATLKTTTHAIRSVRDYVVHLPDESTSTIRAHFRPKFLSTRAPTPRRLVSQPNDPADPLSLIRRSALEVLTTLRELEETARLPLEDDAYDAHSDRASSHGNGHSRVASPSSVSDTLPVVDVDYDPADADTSLSFSLVKVEGREESVLVWEDEGDDSKSGDEEERRKKGHWDERLVVGSGWLYKQHMQLEDLTKEKEVVARYLDFVDGVLFGGPKEGQRGWEKEWERVAKKEKQDKEARKANRRRVSAGDGDFLTVDPPGRSVRRILSVGMLDAMKNMVVTEEPEEAEVSSERTSIDDEDLPDWAKRSSFTKDPLGRAQSMLITFLPARLVSALAPPSPPTAFLSSLSSGQLLCVAYNTCLRKSSKPWGYITAEAIHDIVALEEAQAMEQGKSGDENEKAKRGWTFRRTDNLRLWAGALKIRYVLPILSPPTAGQNGSSASSAASSVRFPSNEPPILFDAAHVARKEDGWEEMLQALLLRWVEAVVEERRGDR